MMVFSPHDKNPFIIGVSLEKGGYGGKKQGRDNV
jgi:hypothetical protein